MGVDTARPANGTGLDADLLAGLWEEAPFPRLPWDAPSELRELVEEVDNPRRVYAIHRASRRHNFQLIVQKYIIQLREGCGVSTCCNPTCFTCRKRIVGKAPVRRYNTTSARTLAIHLASQDNPEAGLCPALKLPKTPPAALDSLLFSPKHIASEGSAHGSYKAQNPFIRSRTHHQRHGGHSGLTGPNGHGVNGGLGHRSDGGELMDKTTRAQAGPPPTSHDEAGRLLDDPKFSVMQKPVSKDYRSFAANLFGTVAFKMFEWLTPAAIDDMTQKAEKLQGEAGPPSKEEVKTPVQTTESTFHSPPSASETAGTNGDANGTVNGVVNGSTKGTANGNANGLIKTVAPASDTSTHGTILSPDAPDVDSTEPSTHSHPLPSQQAQQAQTTHTATAPRSSNTRVRTPSSARPQRKVSVDAFPTDPTSDDLLPALRSPRMSNMQGESMNHKTPQAKSLKPSTTTIPRPISQLSNSGFFDGVSLEKMPPPKTVEVKPIGRGQLDGLRRSSSDTSLHRTVSGASRSTSKDRSLGDQSSVPQDGEEAENAFEALHPQSLTRLNAELVDFVCDVLEEDHTAEKHMLEPPTVARLHTRVDGQPRPLRRKQKRRQHPQTIRLGEEWQLFLEQSIFYVLSDPHALLQSFTKQGQLYDTHTLWYCMLRLTRVAPSLVFHSLWMAAEALFAPPKALQALRSPSARLFPRTQRALTNKEAGILMSICLHALVAAVPVVDDIRKLYDMSRIRAQGLSLAGSGSVARQPPELCLQYDDAFSNDLAIRLARRVLAAITTRRFFDEMIEFDVMPLPGVDDDSERRGYGSTGRNSPDRAMRRIQPEHDVLAQLFGQLDFLNMDAAYILNFSVPDRTLHETRVPTLLLDWARAVMLQDWDGQAIVRGDSPFGGALALIASIHKRRQDLLVGDIQFRIEYFAERLDEMEMPVTWLSFVPSKHELHLLDYPYIFSPDTLVSYFRAINFSRMSRALEEPNSVHSRISAIISPGSFINPHHKTVLQDLLRTASSKYLVLDISRQNVLQDAFDQLWRREERELMRPLKVHLGEDGGEEGFDSGGVQQEFFRLAIAEALNPAYGAFTVDERTRMAWFNPTSLEEDWKFELIGLLVSLAIYNGLSLPVTFPSALYRKLLGEPVTELHHIADGWPDLASGLTTLLEWNEQDGSVEDVFVRTYEFSVDMFGQPLTQVMDASGTWPRIRQSVLGKGKSRRDRFKNDALVKSGDGIIANGNNTIGAHEEVNESAAAPSIPAAADEPPMVTHANRNAYVTDYIHYLTEVSVHPQLRAFRRGFNTCLHPKSVTLLTPPLLQSLVEGQQTIDVHELRRHARYVGWDGSHRTVRDFWSIVSQYDDRMKRKLLEFVTASDRVPVGGVKNLHFVVQRNGEEEGEDGHLPTAYTCYGTLLLPEYRDRAVLRERMAMALENAQGFGFA